MRQKRPLTELEGTVLGVVWSRQPCTPYQVRREFLESPSPQWSGSAGAIYPLMARLQETGMVHSAEHATGSRKSRLYTVTRAGRAALVRWLGPPVPAEVAGVPPDPLRTRVAFMTALPAARRAKFLEEVEARVAEQLAISEQDYKKGDFPGPYYELMGRGAVAAQKLRLAWARECLAFVRAEARRRPGPARRHPFDL